MRAGVGVRRLLERGAGVVGGCNELLGLLAIGLTFSGFGPGWNKSTAARPPLRGWRVFAGPVLLFAGFWRLIVDLGLDKKSCVLTSAGGIAAELAFFLLRLVACSGTGAGTGAVGGSSSLAVCGWGGRLGPEFPDWLVLPD